MSGVFNTKVKNISQLKTKDQNLKKKYFIKSTVKSDLLRVSYDKIVEFIAKNRKIIDKLRL